MEMRGRPPKELKSMVNKYRKQPALWIYDTFGVELWEKQEEIMNAVWNNRWVATKSCFGSGKCIQEDEIITLSDGSRHKVKDLVGRTFKIPSFSPSREEQVSATAWAIPNGTKDVYEVETTWGKKIIRTGNHPLLTTKFKKERNKSTGWSTRHVPQDKMWIKIEDLQKDDIILMPTQLNINNFESPISDEDIKLLGYLLGDGGMTGTHHCTFTQKDNKQLAEMRKIAEINKCELNQSKSNKYTYRIRSTNGHNGEQKNRILDKTRKWGIRHRFDKKRFPFFVWSFSNRQLALLLNRLFACDGTIYTRKEKGFNRQSIEIGLGSEQLIDDISHALLRLGIEHRKRYVKTTYTGTDKTFDSWRISITQDLSILKFINVVGIYGKEDKVNEVKEIIKKQKGLHYYKWHRNAPEGFHWEKIKSVKYLGKDKTVNISVEGTHTFLTDFVEHNSFVSAAIILAFVSLFPDSICISTAPSDRQIENIWDPIHMMLEKSKAPLGCEVLQREIRYAPGHRAIGFTTNMPERLQGIHAKHILIIEDESAGMDGEIHERLSALMVNENAHFLAIGNPLSPEGHFYEMFKDPKFKKFTISAFDTPNLKAGKEVVPGLVTKIWVDEKRQSVGVDSPSWKAEVLGEFPDSAEDTLLPLSWVRQAQERWYEMEEKEKETVYGLDPSGGGMDETVLVARRGMKVYKPKAWQGLESPEIIGRTVANVLENSRVFVDEIGVGFGILGGLRNNDGIYAVGVNAKNKPNDDKRFKNSRAEMYWTLRDLLNPHTSPRLSLPPDEKLAGQLTSIKYKHDTKGRIQIESKKDMRKRGIKSPDRADALVLTLKDYQSYGAKPIGVGYRNSEENINDMLIQTPEFGYIEDLDDI